MNMSHPQGVALSASHDSDALVTRQTRQADRLSLASRHPEAEETVCVVCDLAACTCALARLASWAQVLLHGDTELPGVRRAHRVLQAV